MTLFVLNIMHVKITPVAGPVHGTIRPPGSKSLTNRALIIAALATGITKLTGVLDSVDTRVMVDCLNELGIRVDADFENSTIEVEGTGNVRRGRLIIPVPSAELWCENSGTSIRFLTAMCSIGTGTYRLDGNERMRERPIGPLIDALKQGHVDVSCELGTDCPPVVMYADGLPGGTLNVAGNLSSQYLSGLLMVSPAAEGTMTIEVTGELVSRPYIEMTLEVMRAFGAKFAEPKQNRFEIAASGYLACAYDIEPDASAASYFFAVAAITGGSVTVQGLHRDALQGDIRFVDALVQMGCEAEWNDDSVTVIGKPLTGIDIDMNTISDTAQTLACVAPFASGPTRIRNVAHNRVKETDRISAVVTELKKTGLTVEEHDDGMTIHPSDMHGATIDTYDDHRMAMSFALLGLKVPDIIINDPECTSKTYPHYFDDLAAICGFSDNGVSA